MPLRRDDHFQPEPAFYIDENGQLDPLSWFILNFLRGWALIVVIGGPLWAIWMIPDYIKFWEKQPALASGVTQCFLAVAAPAFLGAARSCRVANLRHYQTSTRISQIVSLAIGAAGVVALIGLAIWDLTKLNDFITFFRVNPGGAWATLIFIGSSLLSGILLGWLIGRSNDADLQRFREQVRRELELRSQRHA